MNFRFNSANFRSRFVLALAFLMATSFGLVRVSDGVAQDEPTLVELQTNYDASMADLRQSVKDLKRAGLLYFYSRSENSLGYSLQWKAAAINGTVALEDILEDAFALFLAQEIPNEQLTRVVYRLNRKYLNSGRLETNYRVTKKLILMFPDDERIQIDMARTALLMNDFAAAEGLDSKIANDAPEFSLIERHLWNDKTALREKYDRELKLQAEEAKANDLPRVELVTTKGTIVVELFENEAPETVGNFVNLVEAGFYDNIIFNNVLKNLTATTGGISTTREEQPVGYTIFDEDDKPNARFHFRGTLSMFPVGKEKNQGASMFYFNLVPAPVVRPRQTVFGRVISGMEVIESLEVTSILGPDGNVETLDEVIWDSIITAKVLRKRDHEYAPNIVKE